MMNCSDTIAAVATGEGGAIAVIRISGPRAIESADAIFRARNGRRLSEAAGYTVHLGAIVDAGVGGETVDEVLVSVFRAPNSYTGEDSVEISCHASPYVKNRVMQMLARAGVRNAGPGEFTVRAFLAGKMDLAQAEAVADLIASAGRSQHSLAMGQMKGGFSSKLAALRDELLDFSSLLELELDFSEEDVQFADRERLKLLAGNIAGELDALIESFSLGNAIREGVPVAIVGRPNVGKSTLLNALAGDDRAMVSEIAGTTRDRIEERVNIDGVIYRFIDTAGLRATDDVLERMGIERTMDAVSKARLVLLVVDAASAADREIALRIEELSLSADQRLCLVLNKIDKIAPEVANEATASDAGVFSGDVMSKTSAIPVKAGESVPLGNGKFYVAGDAPDGAVESPGRGSDEMPVCIAISAKMGLNLDSLRSWLRTNVEAENLYGGSAVVSNSRHYESLLCSRESVDNILDGIERDLSTDLLAEESRDILHSLGTITGEITTDEILSSIFSKFCIGK